MGEIEMIFSRIALALAVALIPCFASAQECPGSESEMDAILLNYNSKASLMLADHPEQINLIGAYQSKLLAAINQTGAAYIRHNATLACQILTNVRPEFDGLERRVCGGTLCAH
jgi:hypothetical protein